MNFYYPALLLMKLKLRGHVQYFIQSNTVNLWQECLNPDLSSCCAMQPFWTQRPVSQTFWPPQDLCNIKEICWEVRKPDQWDVLPARASFNGLYQCVCVFFFSVQHQESRCHCSEHQGVITGNCLAKEWSRWGTESSPRWFSHVRISFWLSEQAWDCADVDTIQHAGFDFVKIKMSAGRNNSPVNSQHTLSLTCLSRQRHCNSLYWSSSRSLSAFQITFLRRDPLKNAGLIVTLSCEIPAGTPKSSRKKSEPLKVAFKTLPGQDLSLQPHFPLLPAQEQSEPLHLTLGCCLIPIVL